MGWFRRRRPGTLRAAGRADIAHLEQFARTHTGVEAYVEPRTTVTETTLLLVAGSGEWTRRRVSGPKAAYEFGRRIGIPVYDAALVGYPARLREWNRQRGPRRGEVGPEARRPPTG